MSKKKESKVAPQNFGAISSKHAERVLGAMRTAMESVPTEHKQSVLSAVYRTVGEGYHRRASNG